MVSHWIDSAFESIMQGAGVILVGFFAHVTDPLSENRVCCNLQASPSNASSLLDGVSVVEAEYEAGQWGLLPGLPKHAHYCLRFTNTVTVRTWMELERNVTLVLQSDGEWPRSYLFISKQVVFWSS